MAGELQDTYIFVLSDNLVFERILYKVTSKRTLFFEIVMRLHQIHMKVELVLHTIHISGTQMIEAGFDGLSRGKKLELIMRGLNNLQFVPLRKGSS